MMRVETVMVVITGELATVQAIDAEGNVIGEAYGRTPEGDPDYQSGNFEDEPELPEGVSEAMGYLQGPILELMYQLKRQR